MYENAPEGYHTLTPSIVVRDGHRAIDFYERAFGAERIDVMTGPGGTVLHAEIQIGDSKLMLGEENPAWPAFRSAESMGGSPASFFLYVSDADAAVERAVAAGAEVEMPVQEMFWGDRMGKVRDPFGYSWGLATRVREMSRDEIQRAAREWMARMAEGGPPTA